MQASNDEIKLLLIATDPGGTRPSECPDRFGTNGRICSDINYLLQQAFLRIPRTFQCRRTHLQQQHLAAAANIVSSPAAIESKKSRPNTDGIVIQGVQCDSLQTVKEFRNKLNNHCSDERDTLADDHSL
jgi:hypothetical protein